MQVNDGIRIRLSMGLIAVAILHAVLLGAVFTTLTPCPPVSHDEAWSLPTTQPTDPSVGRIEKLEQPQSVNLQAQGEVKQQSIADCLPCDPLTKRPTEIAPQSSQLVSNPSSQPAPNKYQIALFVDSDAKSQQLLDWFNHDPKLYKLRTACDFQVYTSSNTLYRSRFASIVPVDQFPVVLFQDTTGGHVHAAGRTMLPASAAELYADLQEGYQLYQQTRQAQKTGALKTRGYSWDDAISPKLQLNSEDCPDGYCPTEPNDKWRPFDRDRDRDGVRDLLFDKAADARSALLWASAGELATIAVIVIAAFLLGFVLIKRGM